MNVETRNNRTTLDRSGCAEVSVSTAGGAETTLAKSNFHSNIKRAGGAEVNFLPETFREDNKSHQRLKGQRQTVINCVFLSH